VIEKIKWKNLGAKNQSLTIFCEKDVRYPRYLSKFSTKLNMIQNFQGVSPFLNPDKHEREYRK